MPLPSPILHPLFNIVRMSHVEYTVSNLTAAKSFWVDTLGLNISHEDATVVYLRAMEEREHHCVILREDSTPRAMVLGFKVFEEEDLDKVKTFFDQYDLPTEWITRPYMRRVLRVRDPWGVPLEFYARMDRLPTIHQQYQHYRGVKPLRIDHFNLFSACVDDAMGFYNQLGFRITEYTEDEKTGKTWAVWMQRKGGVHDIALTNGLGPRLHHTAFWVASPMNIIDLLDLMATTGYVDNIERGPGRHGVSNAFFLYVRDPDGHRIELYCSDYHTMDPDHEPIKWGLADIRRQTLWGMPAPRSWFEEGTLFDGVSLQKSTLKVQPIVAA